MNCILYARVSTEKQAEMELSIPAQLQAMRDYARSHGWIVIEEFLEPGASAKTTERPALQALLARVRNRDLKLGVVLVHKIDRLARNVFDHATIRALLKQHDVRLASVVENVDDTVSGQLVENIMASIAQFYSANLADEVKKGMRQKVLKGGWPHLPPRGYTSVRDSRDGASRVEVHPKEGAIMRRAFELYATGWCSLKAVAARMAKEGLTAKNGQPVAAQHVKRLLTNPFYMGRLRWKDMELAGSHESIVSPDLFAQVQEAMQRRFKDPGAKGSVRGFPLRGIAICASCRGHMTGGAHKIRWRYYQCARRSYNTAFCSAVRYCKVEAAHQAIDDVCAKLRLPYSTIQAILKSARQQIEGRGRDVERQLEALRVTRATLLEREARLTQGFIAGEVSSDAYKLSAAELKGHVVDAERSINRLQQNPGELMRRVEGVVAKAATISELREQLDERRRVEILRAVFDTVVLDASGVVGFTLRPPFDAVLKEAGTKDGEKREVEPLASAIIQHAENLSAEHRTAA